MPTDELTKPEQPDQPEPLQQFEDSTRTDQDPRTWLGLFLLGTLAAAIFIGIWIASGDSEPVDGAEADTTTTISASTEDDDGTLAATGGSDVPPGSIAELFTPDGEFSTFAEALDAAGLPTLLDGDGPFTMFVPSDDSIEPTVLAATVASSEETALQTLNFHIIEGRFTGEELGERRSVETLSGDQLRVFPLAEGASILVNNGVAVRESLDRSNGIVHVVEGILVPPTVSAGSGDVDEATTTTADPGEDDASSDSTTSTPSTTTTAVESSTGDGEGLDQLTSLDPIQFADSSATIADASFTTLDQVAGILEAHPDAQIEIGGHTDDIGPAAGNQRLSERRANAVLDYLVRAGVDGDRLRAVGYGEENPIASNDSDEGRAANRRIEFVVL